MTWQLPYHKRSNFLPVITRVTSNRSKLWFTKENWSICFRTVLSKLKVIDIINVVLLHHLHLVLMSFVLNFFFNLAAITCQMSFGVVPFVVNTHKRVFTNRGTVSVFLWTFLAFYLSRNHST